MSASGNYETLRGKVLFTGSNSLLISDLMRQIPLEFVADKCAPTENALVQKLKIFAPQVLVMCLSDEPRETIRMYAALADDPKLFNLVVIGIGNAEDCAVFDRNISQRNKFVFVRPFEMFKFWNTLKDQVNNQVELAKKVFADRQTATSVEVVLNDKLPNEIEQNEAEKSAKIGYNEDRKTILAVDDDVMMLNVIKAYLQDLYDVVLVPSGKLALKYLEKKHADMVLLDYVMPDADGPAVLELIRKNTACPNIPVIFLTGVNDKNMVIRGLEFKPNGYLLKPIKCETLLEKVTEVLLGL